ncbi:MULTISPECIES: hypothetical protein [unclassified Microcoleus]|uniref:hypothetical protein n=1 Tax=unclassified Microcoleus TaxID=2642155 RepID=UPI002FD5DC92
MLIIIAVRTYALSAKLRHSKHRISAVAPQDLKPTSTPTATIPRLNCNCCGTIKEELKMIDNQQLSLIA